MQRKLNYVIWIAIPILLILFVIFYFCTKNVENTFTKNLFYMDTYIYIKIENQSKEKAEEAFQHIEQIYQEYHQLADRYQAYDGINNLYTIHYNTDPSETLTLDPRLYQMLTFGKEWYAISNGKIDISMGNIIDVWKQYRTTQTGVPTLEELTLNDTGSIKDIVLLENNQIQNTHPNIDLGAIAKGYATEKVGEYLESIGITNYIINAGGNVKVGTPYQKEKYAIGIEDPNSQSGDIFKVVYGQNISVVTSGGYERYYEYNGQKYHHIIDPDTNMPSNWMKSVTIITKDSSLGDILSTLLFLLPIEEGQEFIKQFDAEAIWYTNEDTIITSEGIEIYEQK